MSLSSSGAAVPNPTLQRKLRRCTDPSADDAELMAALRSLSDASDELLGNENRSPAGAAAVAHRATRHLAEP